MWNAKNETQKKHKRWNNDDALSALQVKHMMDGMAKWTEADRIREILREQL